MKRITLVCGSLMLCLLFAHAMSAAEPIATQQFEKLHALIKPQKDEQKWEQIPWLSDLWEARMQAAEEGKPILLWEMDGQPLGCV